MSFPAHSINSRFKGQLIIDYSAEVLVLLHNLYGLTIDNDRGEGRGILPEINLHLFSLRHINVKEGRLTPLSEFLHYGAMLRIIVSKEQHSNLVDKLNGVCVCVCSCVAIFVRTNF